MSQFMECDSVTSLQDRIAHLCYSHYAHLPKKGKPQKNKEWTLMAAVVLQKQSGNTESELKVVSMGTGSKCLGESRMSEAGEVVNDSHAEVIARRAFLLYLYEELKQVYLKEGSEIFTEPSDKAGYRCCLKPDIIFHFFCSHTPCGDASIFPKTEVHSETPLIKDCTNIRKRHSQDAYFQEAKVVKLDDVVSVSSSRDNTLSCKEVDGEESKNNNKKDALSFTCHDSVSPVEGKAESIAVKFVWPGTHAVDRNDHVSDTSRWEHHKDVLPLGQSDAQTLSVRRPKVAENVYEQDKAQSDHGGQTMSGRMECLRDVHRTGAKCVPGGHQDLHLSGEGYHRLGVLRTKPGRGERTLSMSCSDKMARWNVLGCQGSLLSHFLEKPLYFETVIIGKCPWSEEALQRALYNRISAFSTKALPGGFYPHCPKFLQSSLQFEHSCISVESNLGIDTVDDSHIVPCASSIVWYSSHQKDGKLEVIVNGRRQGVTKKDMNRLQARSCISSSSMLVQFKELLKQVPQNVQPLSVRMLDKGKGLDKATYDQCKKSSVHYQTAWSQLFQAQLHTWLRKSRDKYYSFA